MNSNPILRWLILVGVFLMPFIVFLVPGSLFFPFIVGKNVAFRIITEIILGLWIILVAVNPGYRPKKSWLTWGLVGFVLVIGISDLFSPNILKSFWSNFERMEGWVTLIHLLGYYVVLSSILKTEKIWRWFWNTSVLASVIMGIYGSLQLVGKVAINQGGVRLDGTLGNATYLAVYMLFHIFITAWLLAWSTEKKWLQVIYSLIIIFQTFILYHTATRGALIGLLCGAFLSALIIALFEKNRLGFRKVAGGIILSALVVVLGFVAVRNTQFVKENSVLRRFAEISISETTVKSRFLVWGMAWDGFKEKPILGWGQESFNYVFNKYYSPKLYDQEQWFDRTHNVVLDWLIAGGVVGLVLYLNIFMAALYYLKKSDNFSVTDKALFTGLLAAYFIHNLFVFDNIISYLLFFAVLAFIQSQMVGDREPVGQPLKPNLVYRVVAPLALVLTIFFIYVVNVKPLKANTELITALRSAADPEAQLAHFESALSHNTFGNAEITEHIIYQVNQAVVADGSQETKLKFAQFADTALKAQLKRTPDDARYHLFAGSFYRVVGAGEQSLEQLKLALKASPQKQTIMFELANTYISMENYQEAATVLKQAYESEPSFTDAKAFYAIISWYAGNEELSEELLSSFSQAELTNNNRVLNFYADSKQYDRLASVWLARIKQNPTDSQARLSLAATYFEMGQLNKSIEQIQAVINNDPSFREQGEYYISEIRAGRRP